MLDQLSDVLSIGVDDLVGATIIATLHIKSADTSMCALSVVGSAVKIDQHSR